MEEREAHGPPSRRRNVMGIFAAGVVAGGLAIGVGLVGLSAWSPATADSAAPGPGPAGKAPPAGKMVRPDAGRPGGPWGPGLAPPGVLRMGPGPEFGLLRGPSLHGEQTVRKPGGGYQTLANQAGEVTSTSKSSITVKSEDGYSRTYAVDDKTRVLAVRGGISDVAKGDRVQVLAVVEGKDARALRLVDISKIPAAGKKGVLRKQIENPEVMKDMMEKRKEAQAPTAW